MLAETHSVKVFDKVVRTSFYQEPPTETKIALRIWGNLSTFERENLYKLLHPGTFEGKICSEINSASCLVRLWSHVYQQSKKSYPKATFHLFVFKLKDDELYPRVPDDLPDDLAIIFVSKEYSWYSETTPTIFPSKRTIVIEDYFEVPYNKTTPIAYDLHTSSRCPDPFIDEDKAIFPFTVTNKSWIAVIEIFDRVDGDEDCPLFEKYLAEPDVAFSRKYNFTTQTVLSLLSEFVRTFEKSRNTHLSTSIFRDLADLQVLKTHLANFMQRRGAHEDTIKDAVKSLCDLCPPCAEFEQTEKVLSTIYFIDRWSTTTTNHEAKRYYSTSKASSLLIACKHLIEPIPGPSPITRDFSYVTIPTLTKPF